MTMTSTEINRRIIDLQAARLRAQFQATKPKRRERHAALKRNQTTPPMGVPCHVCDARFDSYIDWERHAAQSGHDARRGRPVPAVRHDTVGPTVRYITTADVSFHMTPGVRYATADW